MDTRKKISLLEEMLDLEEGSLNAEMSLSDIPEYDSMAKLSLIVLFDDEFGKKLSGEKIREFKTIGDILAFMD